MEWQDKKRFIMEVIRPDEKFCQSLPWPLLAGEQRRRQGKGALRGSASCESQLPANLSCRSVTFREQPHEEKQFWLDLTIDTPRNEIQNMSADSSACLD